MVFVILFFWQKIKRPYVCKPIASRQRSWIYSLIWRLFLLLTLEIFNTRFKILSFSLKFSNFRNYLTPWVSTRWESMTIFHQTLMLTTMVPSKSVYFFVYNKIPQTSFLCFPTFKTHKNIILGEWFFFLTDYNTLPHGCAEK